MSKTVRKEVTDPKEYKEAIDAAETLGLSLQKVRAFGHGWSSPDAEAVHPDAGGSGVEIVKVGRKYFHMKLGGPDGVKTVPVECTRAPVETLNDGKLVLKFA